MLARTNAPRGPGSASHSPASSMRTRSTAPATWPPRSASTSISAMAESRIDVRDRLARKLEVDRHGHHAGSHDADNRRSGTGHCCRQQADRWRRAAKPRRSRPAGHRVGLRMKLRIGDRRASTPSAANIDQPGMVARRCHREATSPRLETTWTRSSTRLGAIAAAADGGQPVLVVVDIDVDNADGPAYPARRGLRRRRCRSTAAGSRPGS